MVYFSGGGGSGAVARLISDINYAEHLEFSGVQNKYGFAGYIQKVEIINSGSGYESIPTPIIVDYSPTWDNIEMNRKNYISNSIKYLDKTITYNHRGILPVMNLLFTNYKPFEIRNIANLGRSEFLYYSDYPGVVDRRQISEPFNTRSFGRSYVSKIFGRSGDDFLVNIHYHYGKIDEILINDTVFNGYPFRPRNHYNDTPTISIVNAAEIANSGVVLPVFEAFIPKWDREKFSANILYRNFDAES